VLLVGCIVASLALTWGPSRRAQAARARSGQRAACIFDHMMLRSPTTKCRPHARAYPSTVKGRVQRSIYDSALTFGIPFSVLLNIAKCESSLNPRAVHGEHYGLFQFVPATFREAASRLRANTGVTVKSFWNPLDSAYVAGFMFVTGDSRRWSCEPPLG
jgi:Transglycosylase SLT domain